MVDKPPGFIDKKGHQAYNIGGNMSKKKVFVGMSGGVDSSVCAALLIQEGYEVTGVAMEIFDDSFPPVANHFHACFGPGEKEDLADAQHVADQLGIKLLTIDLKQEYREQILDFFIREYEQGRTPNPCIHCNRKMKFGAIVRELENMGYQYDYFATGHYARIEYEAENDRHVLKQATDLSKDQSYFLYYLKRDQLHKIKFPLGALAKNEVRSLAKKLGINIHDKPESQDFIEGGYQQLFKGNYRPGPIKNRQGDVLGQHRGIVYYTVGQRKGMGISHQYPLYVVAKDKERNTLVVGSKEELFASELVAEDLNWLVLPRELTKFAVKAKIRYNHKKAAAEVQVMENGQAKIRFFEPQMAITPGQSVVLYDGETVIGGGIIHREIRDGD